MHYKHFIVTFLPCPHDNNNVGGQGIIIVLLQGEPCDHVEILFFIQFFQRKLLLLVLRGYDDTH